MCSRKNIEDSSLNTILIPLNILEGMGVAFTKGGGWGGGGSCIILSLKCS